MTLEDYTTYTEVDEQSSFTVTAHKIYGTVDRDVTSYVVKDFIAGHFGDFEHLVECEITIWQSNTGVCCWALSNGVNDLRSLANGFGCYFEPPPTADKVNIYLITMGPYTWGDYSSVAIAKYWMTLSRTGTTLTGKIYSDAARTTLVDTISQAVASTTWRYCYAMNSQDYSSGGYDATFTIENLDLQEKVALKQPFGMPRRLGMPTPMNVGLGM